MRKFVPYIFLTLFIAGCATVPQRVHFDQANFDSMQNVAVLVTETAVRATGNAWVWYADIDDFKLPIAWYINKLWSYDRPITMEGGDSKSGWSWKAEYGALDSRLTVDRRMSRALNDYSGEYNIQKSLREELINKLGQIKGFNFISSQKIDEVLTTSSKLGKDWHGQQEALRTDLSADTLFLTYIPIWGFHRGMMSKKGNFSISLNFQIIRLSDQAILWQDWVEVDFFEGKFKKECKDFDDFFKDNKSIFSQTLRELIDITVTQILEGFKS